MTFFTKNDTKKSINLSHLFIAFLSLFTFSLIAQPTGPRLKDIGNPVLIGSRIHAGGADIHGVPNDNSANGIYTTVANSEFNLCQVSWYPRWDNWNEFGNHGFGGVNGVINWGNDNNKTVMIHMPIGADTYSPDWFLNGTYPTNEMDSLLKEMIYSIMDSNNNKDKVDVWNVMNEVFNDNGTYRSMKWNELGWETDESGLTGGHQINTQHPIFIGKILEYARDKTDAILEIRDYLIENNNSSSGWDKKHRAFFQLINHLLAKGYPLDAVGIQGHYQVGNTNWILSDLANSIQKFKTTGVEVYMTEVDIASPNAWNMTTIQQQRDDYFNVLTTAIDAGVTMISLWGFRDTHDPFWLADQHPLVFDESYQPKPAYYGVQDALMTTAPVAVENIEKDALIQVFPNPTTNELFVQWEDLGNEPIQVEVLDLFGKNVLRKNIQKENNQFSILTNSFLSGTYFLKISTRNQIVTKRFVKL